MSETIKEGLRFMQSLPEQEKAKLFDKIAGHYYDGNFGTLSKSQIDLLMFSIYLDALRDAQMRTDDYTLGKQLGILQPNVRQLKKKKQLAYPGEYLWHKEFLACAETARMDGAGRILICIRDPVVHLELQNVIEEMGGFVETQLNAKLLRIPSDYFVKLLLQIYRLENTDVKAAKAFEADFMARLKAGYKAEQESLSQVTEQTLGERIKENGIDTALEILIELLPGGVMLKTIKIIYDNLLKKSS